MSKKVYRICITGGERKTTLCQLLCDHYKEKKYVCSWVPEYAREYLENRDFDKNPYQIEDFISIAKGQVNSVISATKDLQMKEESLDVPRLLFCDTDALITLMWSEYLVHDIKVTEDANNSKYLNTLNALNVVFEMAATDYARSIYDLWIETDFSTVAYAPDPLRYLPELEQRKEFHEKLTKEMEKRKYNFQLISGSYENRFHHSISIIDSFIDLQESSSNINKDENYTIFF